MCVVIGSHRKLQVRIRPSEMGYKPMSLQPENSEFEDSISQCGDMRSEMIED